MQSDRISSTETPQKTPRRSMHRSISTLRRPRSHISNRKSTLNPYSYSSRNVDKIIEEVETEIIKIVGFCCLGLCGIMFLAYLSLILISAVEEIIDNEQISEFLYLIYSTVFGLVTLLFLFIILIIIFTTCAGVMTPSTSTTSRGHMTIPLERTVKICEICNSKNNRSRKNCLKCGASLSYVPESTKREGRLLYQKTSKEKALTEETKEERPKPDPTESLVEKKKAQLPRERANQKCEICHFQNSISRKYCLNCGAPLSLMSESMKKSFQSLYRKTYKRDVKNKKTKQFSREHLSCHICGYLIDIGMDTCPDCGTKRIECPICLRHLNFTDDIAYCFFCETNFHFSHLMEFVKIRGKCPICKERLLSSEVIRKYQQKPGENA